VFTHFFFVPNRLLYDNWQSFITGGPQGTDQPTFPVMTLNQANRAVWAFSGSLADYFGIPIPGAPAITIPYDVNALPFRAYQQIYNDYYRDQTLSTPAAITKNDTVAGGELNALLQLQKRYWEKDYFTSALPWTQRGAQVNIPNTINYSSNPQLTFASAPSSMDYLITQSGTNPTGIASNTGARAVTKIANLQGIDISLINLRRAARLQEWLEKNATGGSRYIEQILAHFGVKSSDARLQRSEYLGGGKTPVVVSEVLSMVKEATNPQGTMTGHGISVGQHGGFNKFFEEHGYVIGIMSVIPRTAYQQGMPRYLQKGDRYDWFWPEFSQIGEQAIYNKELYLDWSEGVNHNEDIFGYTPRYAEYKFQQSTVHGDFKNTLNYWHLGRIFGARPSLNDAFVRSDPTTRAYAVTDGQHLWVQLYNSVKAIRPMPVFGTPTL
jgi:hypothetical protein